jgi:formylglycine-generating enzyme required for sulfatase activity
MNKLLILSLLALGYQTASAQLVTESFGSGANAFTMDFVTIGNPNNAADTTGSPNPAGSVGYIYNIGKYEVSRDMIEKASLGIDLWYRTVGNQPATGISWHGAAKFVNWLNTSTGGAAAYKFDSSGNFQLWSAGDAGYNANNLFRNSLAKYWLPSTDEWYKGAYGSPNGNWYKYPTGSDSSPTPVASGTDPNTAVHAQSARFPYDPSWHPADVTDAGGLSAYGTMAQGGNAWEWMETAFDGVNNSADETREFRGGNWNGGGIDASSRMQFEPSSQNVWGTFDFGGFRVASVPEPSSLSLLALGGVVVALRRRKK